MKQIGLFLLEKTTNLKIRGERTIAEETTREGKKSLKVSIITHFRSTQSTSPRNNIFFILVEIILLSKVLILPDVIVVPQTLTTIRSLRELSSINFISYNMITFLALLSRFSR